MKYTTITLCLLMVIAGSAQDKPKEISTIDFVQILENQKDRAYHYYENNWSILRALALERGYISSYQWIETEYTEEAPFHFMFITSYPDQKAFDDREANFRIIMEGRTMELLDDQQPEVFRKSVFLKEAAKVLRRD